MMKKLTLVAGIAGMLSSPAAMAANQSVTANVAFASSLSLVKNADINFGTVTASSASTYKITTAAIVTTTAGTGSWLFGTPEAGNISVIGSSSQTLEISVGGYTAQGGVTPQNATCSYDGGAEGSCTISGGASPGAGKTLLVGVEIVADGTQASGSTATPSFTITVVYT